MKMTLAFSLAHTAGQATISPAWAVLTMVIVVVRGAVARLAAPA